MCRKLILSAFVYNSFERPTTVRRYPDVYVKSKRMDGRKITAEARAVATSIISRPTGVVSNEKIDGR